MTQKATITAEDATRLKDIANLQIKLLQRDIMLSKDEAMNSINELQIKYIEETLERAKVSIYYQDEDKHTKKVLLKIKPKKDRLYFYRLFVVIKSFGIKNTINIFKILSQRKLELYIICDENIDVLMFKRLGLMGIDSYLVKQGELIKL